MTRELLPKIKQAYSDSDNVVKQTVTKKNSKTVLTTNKLINNITKR
jgi:hypothetical protein